MLDPVSEKFPPNVAFEAAAMLRKMTITVLYTSREGNYNYFKSSRKNCYFDAPGHYHCLLNLLGVFIASKCIEFLVDFEISQTTDKMVITYKHLRFLADLEIITDNRQNGHNI